MTTDGMSLFRKKKFPYPINLPDTPSDMLEGKMMEYEYRDSRLGADELPGLPSEFYDHLKVKYQKIKAYQQHGAPLDVNDPALFYSPASHSDAPEPSPSEVPSTPASTPASASDESSDAGLGPEDGGEEVDSEVVAEAGQAAAEALASKIIENAAGELIEEMADQVMDASEGRGEEVEANANDSQQM